MANNLTSNTVEKLARTFVEKMEASKCLCKAVDTQLIKDKFTPSSGGTVSVKRPTDYKSHRTADGDISAVTKSDIIVGKATATVQDYITVAVEWENIEEALELDQLDELLAPMADRVITDLETSLANYMRVNAGLSIGNPDNAVDAWGDVAYAGALMKSIGVPKGNGLHYIMNSFTSTSLANAQNGLNASDQLVRTAWERAQISENFGGMRVMACETLETMQDDATLADRAGVLAANPDVTYVTHKDNMIQSMSVSGFTANADIVAGSIVEITGRYYINQSTRKGFIDQTGAQVKYRGVVTESVTLSGTGTGTIQVAGPAIYEATGQYNTVDSAVVSGDVITVLGTAGYTSQPNLFFHKQAFGLATVKLNKLYSTDTVAVMKDGMSIRVCKYADGDSNTQKVRFDLLPAFVTFNPFFAGLGYGL